MQAVADRLGVDRKAVNHHVRDRDSLLELVAGEAFAENFAAARISKATTWQDACRAYAVAFTNSLTSIGVLRDYLRPGDFTGILSPTELLVGQFLAAGFTDEQASQCLTLLTVICGGLADVARVTRDAGEHSGLAALRRAEAAPDAPAFELLARMADPSIDTSGPGQFETSLDVYIAGCETLLARRLRRDTQD